jgi:putative CRISPR-associated protein (TIGR02619 family)
MVQNLICTVGTSLFGNLTSLEKKYKDSPHLLKTEEKELVENYSSKNWIGVAKNLLKFPSSERICGAEINSITSMISLNYIPSGCRLFFCCSETDDGKAIGAILKNYYEAKKQEVKILEIKALQDRDPKKFRTYGLRNLAKEICKIIRSFSSSSCAINATGGYKAQIAIAVMLGQAIGVPVYYKHERFDEIILFPPMPVSLDFEVWMKASSMLFTLETSREPVLLEEYKEEWEERFESLVEPVEIDGKNYIELSATGQIFHDTFNERFKINQKELLPPSVKKEDKKEPKWEQSGHMRNYPEILKFMKSVTDEIPCVIHCYTYHFNPNLSSLTRFKSAPEGIEGIYSNGTYTVKFAVKTTAVEPSQINAVVTYLNRWLASK